MQIGKIKLDKPFGVLVKTSQKTVLKQFDSEEEALAFGRQLMKFDNVEFEIIEKPTKGIHGRENSPAFVKIPTDKVPEGYYYKCIPVRPLKGHLFCTECHDYKKFVKEKDEYGSEFHVCPDCGIPDTDFYIKTANNLWDKK
jgi:hypothetical protein